MENRPISFSDFVTEADYMEFCEPVLNFQSDIVCETVKNQDIAEYIEFAEGKALDQIEKVSPEFLIAPYFYLDSKDLDNWLKANSELVKASLKPYYLCISTGPSITTYGEKERRIGLRD